MAVGTRRKLWDISTNLKTNTELPEAKASLLGIFPDPANEIEPPKIGQINPNNEPGQPSGSLLRTLTSHSDKVKSLAFSPDGARLASADLSGTIKLWQMNTGEIEGTLKGHSTWVELAFNPQDKTLISGSFDDTVKVWRLSP